MIALALILSMLGGAALADGPVVVRVGDFSYTQSQLQGSLDSMLELSELLRGDAPTDEEKAARLQATIDSFVGLGVIENKLTEAGKNGFSEAELEDLRQAANSKYDEFWQLLYQQMQKSDESVEEKDVTDTLEAMGYTYEAIYDEYVLQARQNRAIDLFVGDFALTQAQVDAYYEEQFVGPDREDYKDDLEKYESEILANDNESFYTPEGYRYIRQIVLQYPEEALSACKREEIQMRRAAQSMAQALQSLTVTVTKSDSWTDELSEAKTDYDRATEQLTDVQNAYMDALKAATEPLVRDEIDEIMGQFNAGIDFGSLVNKYSTDRTDKNLNGDGYPFHPDSPNWPESFSAAARALEKPGDISGPVYTEEGVHILYYTGDVPAGDYVLTDDQRKLLNAAALRYYQLEKLDELVEGWEADYEIETHPELLKY
jgi:parvulin-like peptidyl-prolyl isomerase